MASLRTKRPALFYRSQRRIPMAARGRLKVFFVVHRQRGAQNLTSFTQLPHGLQRYAIQERIRRMHPPRPGRQGRYIRFFRRQLYAGNKKEPSCSSKRSCAKEGVGPSLSLHAKELYVCKFFKFIELARIVEMTTSNLHNALPEKCFLSSKMH